MHDRYLVTTQALVLHGAYLLWGLSEQVLQRLAFSWCQQLALLQRPVAPGAALCELLDVSRVVPGLPY